MFVLFFLVSTGFVPFFMLCYVSKFYAMIDVCLGSAVVVDKQKGRKYGGGQISCDCEKIDL